MDTILSAKKIGYLSVKIEEYTQELDYRLMPDTRAYIACLLHELTILHGQLRKQLDDIGLQGKY